MDSFQSLNWIGYACVIYLFWFPMLLMFGTITAVALFALSYQLGSKKVLNLCINQFQARTSLPGQPPGFCTYFQPGSRGFVPSELPGGRTYYQSTKLSVDAA